MKNVKLNRRRFLAASGLVAGSLFLPSLRARAQSSGPPKRLIIFFTQHGTVYGNWNMRPPGVSTANGFDVPLSSMTADQFSPILRPLHGHRQKLLVVDGLAMATCEADDPINSHDLGTRAALTAALLQNGSAGGPSIDQVVAQEVRVDGRIDSLELAVVQARNGGAVWRAAGQSISPDTSPSSVFNRVFPASFVGNTPSQAERLAALQSSVLDVVKDEYAALAPRLGGADRQKLELHRDLVRDLETRLAVLPSAECVRPAQPGGGSYDADTEAMFSLVAAALSCDLTRVVTIQMEQLSTSMVGAPPGDIHADYAHQQEGNGFAREIMTNYGVHHAEQFAALLSKLDSIPEGNGTLLDNCAVVWCSELADGVHHYRPWPVVIGGGALRAGRYVYCAQNDPNPSPYTEYASYTPLIGPPHNKLWTSVARAVGADIDSHGTTSLDLPDGGALDTTGPLEEIA